jgi:4-amino-4-deoxy-L-arabinose transferase
MQLKRPTAALAVASLILAFAFQGTRGIWEPDEGFYVSAARLMVVTGDWLVPQVNSRPFIDKPPMVYWGSAAAMEVFGVNEWTARLPNAFWYLMTVLLAGLAGRSFWDGKTGLLSALIYATSVIPLAAENVVTPDTPLAFWVTASMFFFWKSTSAPTGAGRVPWTFLLGISLGLGTLSKGPAMLVFLAPMALYLLKTGRARQFLVRWDAVIGLILFVVIGASWYIALFRVIPGAFAYVWDNQVMGRLFTTKYNRNPEVYAPLYVYLPVLVFGSLPWSIAWYVSLFKSTRKGSGWRGWLSLPEDSRHLFLFFWIVAPAVVFSLARSRLPLYVLPLFAPLAVASARCWLNWMPNLGSPPFAVAKWAPVALWCLILVGVKAGFAYWPTDRDTRAFWESIRDLLPPSRHQLVLVNTRRHGLSFYSQGNVEWVTTSSTPYTFFSSQRSLEEEVHELSTTSESHVFIVRDRDYKEVSGVIRAHAASVEETTGPFRCRLLFTKPAAPEKQIVRLVAMGDTRTGNSNQVQLGAALYYVDDTTPLDGIVLLGDNISFDGDPVNFEDHFAKPYEPLIRNGVKFFAVLGNHDIAGGYMAFQLNQSLFNMGGQRYYTRIFGDDLVQVFFLDSNTLAGDPRQLSWLIKGLGQSPAVWKVVAMHVPIVGGIHRRPMPDPALRRLLEPIFVDGGVDVVIAGHNHVYQRFRPRQGVNYFTAGSGGELDRGQLLPGDPDLLAGEDQTNVALILEFSGDECHFRAINCIGQEVDQGRFSRRGAGTVGGI